MHVNPPMAAKMINGSKHAKIIRQPAIPTISPPMAGPRAGPRAIVKVAKPMIVAVFLKGTCSRMMLLIIGMAIPVPIPCSIRPMIKTRKLGDHIPSKVPARKKKIAAPNSVRVRKHFFNQDDVGMMMASINRLMVVTHCTVDVVMLNSFINVGKMTFIAVSAHTPVNVSNPVATTEIITRASKRRSN